MAMVSLSDPDIILLDEPTAKLDDYNISLTLEAIERVWQNKLVLIVSHDKLLISVPFTELCLEGGKLR